MSSWACLSCTFINSPALTVCELCEAQCPKGGSTFSEVLEMLRECFNVASISLKHVNAEGSHTITSAPQLAQLREEMSHWPAATLCLSTAEDREVADLKQRVIFLENQLARLSREGVLAPSHSKSEQQEFVAVHVANADNVTRGPVDELHELLRACWDKRKLCLDNMIVATLGSWLGEQVLAYSHPFDDLVSRPLLPLSTDPFRTPNSLRLLDLARAPLPPALLPVLAQSLRDNTSLTSLNLSAVDLPEKDLLQLTTALATCPLLMHLDLSHISMGDVGCEGVCALVPSLPLRSLILDNNCISSPEPIVSAMTDPGCCLESLSLLFNDFLQGHLYSLLQAMSGNTRLTKFGASSKFRGVRHSEFDAELPIYLERNQELHRAREQRVALMMGLSPTLGRDCALLSLRSSPLFDMRALGLVWSFLFPQPPGARLRALLQQLKQEHEDLKNQI